MACPRKRIKNKTKNITRVEWLETEIVWPIKNGLYYVSDGTTVAVSYFDKEKPEVC